MLARVILHNRAPHWTFIFVCFYIPQNTKLLKLFQTRDGANFVKTFGVIKLSHFYHRKLCCVQASNWQCSQLWWKLQYKYIYLVCTTTLSITILSILYRYAKCHYTECCIFHCYAECCHAECCSVCTTTLSITILRILYRYAKCHYTECCIFHCYAECRHAQCYSVCTITLSITILRILYR